MIELKVDRANHIYPIVIEKDLLLDNAIASYFNYRQIAIITNQVVGDYYLAKLIKHFNNQQLLEIKIPDGEQYKNLTQLSYVFDLLIENRFNRDCLIIALGGGVIGDLAGFAAACYQRGVDFVQIPTSLLAQVDSSVGGKTGVNHSLGKNLLGAFYQPKAVLIDLSVLNTLPKREFSAGMAEVIKYSLISNDDFFIFLEQNIDSIMKQNTDLLREMIGRCCLIKADIVAKDEKESGVRAWLNLGHTFGHALEALSEYKLYKHGEAVGLGILMAMNLAKNLNRSNQDQIDRVKNLIQKANLPIKPLTKVDPDALLDFMALDKKVRAGKWRLIVPNGLNGVDILEDVDKADIYQAIVNN